jgi:hypothetical protein
MNSYPLGISLLVWMKTQSMMITPTIKSTFNDSTTEFCCVDSILKLICVDFKSENFKSIPTDSRVESSIVYSRPKVFLANSKLEYVVQLKIPSILTKKSFIVKCQLFGQSLLKSDGPKISSS